MQSPSNDDKTNKLSDGMLAKYDQMHASWGSYADAIGYFYNELRRWNIREEYAIQLAAKFQTHIEFLLETEASTEAMDKMLSDREAKKAAKLSE